MSAESIEYQPPVSSTAHQSLRQWIRNRWGCVVVVATVLYNFVLNGLLFNYNLLFVAFQQEFESSATLTGISNDCIYYINRGKGGGSNDTWFRRAPCCSEILPATVQPWTIKYLYTRSKTNLLNTERNGVVECLSIFTLANETMI